MHKDLIILMVKMSVVAISMPFLSEHCHSHCTKLLGSRKAVIRITGQNSPLNATLWIFCLTCTSLGCVVCSSWRQGPKMQKASAMNSTRGRCVLTVHRHLAFCHCPFSTSCTAPTSEERWWTVEISEKHNIRIISHGCDSLLSHSPKYTESVTGY